MSTSDVTNKAPETSKASETSSSNVASKASETGYKIEANRDCVDVVIKSGFYYQRYEITTNIRKTIKYIRKLLSIGYSGTIEIAIPLKNNYRTTIGIYPPGSITDNLGSPMEETTFRFGVMYVPVRNMDFISDFINDLDNSMDEYYSYSNKNSVDEYKPPSVSLTKKDGDWVLRISTPNPDGKTLVERSFIVRELALLGMFDLFDIAHDKDNVGDKIVVGGPKVSSSLVQNARKTGWVYNSVDAMGDRLVSPIYVDNGMLEMVSEALKSSDAPIFDGEDIKSMLILNGKSTSPLSNPRMPVIESKTAPAPEQVMVAPDSVNCDYGRIMSMIRFPAVVPKQYQFTLGGLTTYHGLITWLYCADPTTRLEVAKAFLDLQNKN